MKVILDSGHGGIDSGSQANGIIEKEYTLKMTKYIYDRLRELGVNTVMTRDEDVTLTPKERIAKIKELGDIKGNILVSNHINAGGGDGAEVIYALRSNSIFANKILEELGKEGQNLRKAYQRRLPSDSSKDYYFLMRDTTNLEPVIVEYGFLDSNVDDVTQLKNDWQDFAEATVRAILSYTDTGYIPPVGTDIHVVKKGESLYNIANKYGVTVADLKDFNNLTSDNIYPGVVLKIPIKTEIPNKPSEYDIYTVKAGDSLYSIANKFGITVSDIKQLNALTNNTLSIGQQLRIPSQGESTIEDNYTVYIVQSGDNLYSIASRFDTSVDVIKSTNNLTSNSLSLGQQLLIPKSTSIVTPTTTYTVKRGDSLYSIASKFNVAVNDIISQNNLSSNLLSIGQILKIPNKPLETGYIIYTVKSGDSLYKLANKYNTTVNEIMNLSNINSTSLSIGQELKIPV
ncbi:MAG: LysM peptidoglycan-binding domain-containing protein [Bacilli bacterium]